MNVTSSSHAVITIYADLPPLSVSRYASLPFSSFPLSFLSSCLIFPFVSSFLCLSFLICYFRCEPHAPLIQVIDQDLQMETRAADSVLVAVTNRDSLACEASDFQFSVLDEPPLQFARISIYPTYMSLLPGQVWARVEYRESIYYNKMEIPATIL